jgi:hypothetical protein
MNFKEFYHWLDGFITSKDETYILQSDLNLIRLKMKEVRMESKVNILNEVPIPKAPVFKITTTTNDPQLINE